MTKIKALIAGALLAGAVTASASLGGHISAMDNVGTKTGAQCITGSLCHAPTMGSTVSS